MGFDKFKKCHVPTLCMYIFKIHIIIDSVYVLCYFNLIYIGKSVFTILFFIPFCVSDL